MYVLSEPYLCECKTKHKEIDPPILKTVGLTLEGLKVKCLCGREGLTTRYTIETTEENYEWFY